MARGQQIALVRRRYERALRASTKMSNALQLLSIAASELYGEELDAQICNGYEIEFRTADNPDGLSDISLRLEDIL